MSEKKVLDIGTFHGIICVQGSRAVAGVDGRQQLGTTANLFFWRGSSTAEHWRLTATQVVGKTKGCGFNSYPRHYCWIFFYELFFNYTRFKSMRKNMSKANQVGLSLAKALKIKNRLAGRLAKTNLSIQQYNCTVEGRKGEVDVKELDTLRTNLVAALVDLKTAIFEANKGIYRSIILIGEKKGEIEFLSGLNTKHGTEPHGYQSQQVTYVSVIQKTEVDKRVKQLEKEIDDLQDAIDKYNAEPERIRVSESVLELAS